MPVVEINSTLAITLRDGMIFQKVIAAEDCAVRALLTKANNCTMVILPLKYDEWQNVVAFHSNGCL